MNCVLKFVPNATETASSVMGMTVAVTAVFVWIAPKAMQDSAKNAWFAVDVL